MLPYMAYMDPMGLATSHSVQLDSHTSLSNFGVRYHIMAEMLSLNRLNQNRWICWCGFWNVSYTPTLCWCAYSPCFSMGFLMLMRISPRISWRGLVHRKPLRLRGNNWFPVFFFPSIEWVTSMFLYKADFSSIRNWINIVAITKKKKTD